VLRVDEATAALVRRAILQAQDRGVDVVRVLDERGLLHYAARQRRLTVDTLRQAAELLDQCTVDQLRGAERLASTPLDLKRQIVRWLHGEADRMHEAGEPK
jgi:hypothetical protein